MNSILYTVLYVCAMCDATDRAAQLTIQIRATFSYSIIYVNTPKLTDDDKRQYDNDNDNNDNDNDNNNNKEEHRCCEW
jgi:hypothetical protein